MLAPNWLMWPPLVRTLCQLITCALLLLSATALLPGSHAQSENAIGAHRVFEKTSFSCAGRPAGYYADVETGCQVYHMCDGLGRQFSYSCPNTTLFQQRMLICDHWYMVNCSKAESHYAANLLIGQRDKPFVGDEESNLRTPRPDLLDRPYAPDYSGESFRNQYKQLPAVANQIQDSSKKADKPSQSAPGPQRWQIPPPSRTIQPPSFEEQAAADIAHKATTPVHSAATEAPRINQRQPGSGTTATRRPSTTTATVAPYRRQNAGTFNSAPLLQRPQEHDDLGTSHSTRYNTSADFNSAENANDKAPSSFGGRKTVVTAANAGSTATSAAPPKSAVKVPSKIYEPPFLYPIYNQDDTVVSTSTAAPARISSAAPFSPPAPVRASAFTTTSTTRQPLNRPTTLAGKPFTASSFPSTVAPPAAAPLNPFLASSGRNQNNIRFDGAKPAKDARQPAAAQGFQPPTPRPPVNSAKTLRPPSTAPRVEASALDYDVPSKNRFNLPTPFSSATASSTATNEAGRRQDVPANDLLPPFTEFVHHDDATTQGPPIYYEWKVPSNGLEPPKLEPPYGVDGREYPDSAVDYNSISTTSDFTPSTSFSIDQGGRPTATNKGNPFLPSARQQQQQARAAEVATTRTPTSRSVKETGQPNVVNRKSQHSRKASAAAATSISTTAKSARGRAAPSANKAPAETGDIQTLREELSVPDYSFPLETIGRTGYLASDTYNSFQLKIPEQRSDADDDHQHWFGENPKCPECHPSYVVPGTCEPCLRR